MRGTRYEGYMMDAGREGGIVEDKECIYINIRVRIRVTRAPACSMRKRTIQKKFIIAYVKRVKRA